MSEGDFLGSRTGEGTWVSQPVGPTLIGLDRDTLNRKKKK